MNGTEGDVPARIEAIEAALDDLHHRIETCRQAMILSRAAIGLGFAVLGFVTIIARAYGSAAIVLGSFTAIIGGIVWLGASKSTKDELETKHAGIARERDALFDTVAERNGWVNGGMTTLH